MISTEPPTTPSDGEQSGQERLTKRDAIIAKALGVSEEHAIMANDFDTIRSVSYRTLRKIADAALTQGVVGDSSPPSPDSAGSDSP